MTDQFINPEEEPTKTCPDCNGTGVDQIDINPNPCPTCEGAGKVSTKPEEPPDEWYD